MAEQDQRRCLHAQGAGQGAQPPGRGFTFQLNLSALHGIGGAHRDCVAVLRGMVGVVYGV